MTWHIMRIISFVVLGIIVVFALTFTSPFVISKLIDTVTWVRIYERPSQIGGKIKGKWFRRRDYWQLGRGGMVGTDIIGKRWLSGGTLTDARKFLSEAALADAISRNKERQETFARRPRWVWEAEHPTFEAWYKWTDKLFKLFQWLAVSAALQYVGIKTDEQVITWIGRSLAFAAIAPYVWLCVEFFHVRLEVTPDSSGRYLARYLAIVLFINVCILIAVGNYAPSLVSALVQAQEKDVPAVRPLDRGRALE